MVFFPNSFEMSITSQPTKKPDTVYENEMHKLNTELQIALLKWKIKSIEKKKTKFEF